MPLNMPYTMESLLKLLTPTLLGLDIVAKMEDSLLSAKLEIQPTDPVMESEINCRYTLYLWQ